MTAPDLTFYFTLSYPLWFLSPSSCNAESSALSFSFYNITSSHSIKSSSAPVRLRRRRRHPAVTVAWCCARPRLVLLAVVLDPMVLVEISAMPDSLPHLIIDCIVDSPFGHLRLLQR
jgi:hypothetical protein